MGHDPYSYLAMTKRPCTRTRGPAGAPAPPAAATLFVYPMEKKREWYALPAEERLRIMREPHRDRPPLPAVTLNTAYSFGLDDQEFVVSFECDEPADFLDLVQELRGQRVELLDAPRHPDLLLRLDVVGPGPRPSTAPRRPRLEPAGA